MTKSCSVCGKANRATARFCAHCASEMGQTCHVCNAENLATARFCHNCATALTGRFPDLHLASTGLLIANTVLTGRYRIIQKVGQGGMGAVYKATDTRLGDKIVAVKEMSQAALTTLLEKQRAQQAFQQEAQMLANLNHPYLPRVTDHFSEGGKQYLVMDFIHGHTLLQLLERAGGPLDVEQVVAWGKKLCDVLEYLHNQQPPIIFRDLKPDNIMLDQKGQIKLIDFGIVRLFKKGQNTDTISIGTTGYAPPEQHGQGQTDFRSDIYALGATLHHLLTYHNPKQSLFNFPPIRQLNKKVPKSVEDVIIRALAPDPNRRWQSMPQMRDALVAATLPQRATPATSLPPKGHDRTSRTRQIKKNPPAASQLKSNAPTKKWDKNKPLPIPPPISQPEPPKATTVVKPSPPPPTPTVVKPSSPAKQKPAKKTKSATTKPRKKADPEQPRSVKAASFASSLKTHILAGLRSYFIIVPVTAIIFAAAKLILFGPLLILPDLLAAALWWIAAPLAYMLTRRPGAAFLTHSLDYMAYVWILGALAPKEFIWLTPGAIIELFLARGGYQKRSYQKVVGACLVASVVSLVLLLITGWQGSVYGLLLQLGGAFLGSSMAYLIGRVLRK